MAGCGAVVLRGPPERMLKVDQVDVIRHKVWVDSRSHRQVAKEFGIWRTRSSSTSDAAARVADRPGPAGRGLAGEGGGRGVEAAAREVFVSLTYRPGDLAEVDSPRAGDPSASTTSAPGYVFEMQAQSVPAAAELDSVATLRCCGRGSPSAVGAAPVSRCATRCCGPRCGDDVAKNAILAAKFGRPVQSGHEWSSISSSVSWRHSKPAV